MRSLCGGAARVRLLPMGAVMQGVLVDLNESGCAIETEMALCAEQGCEVEIELNLRGVALLCSGFLRNLRHLRRPHRETRIGIKFAAELGPGAEQLRLLCQGVQMPDGRLRAAVEKSTPSHRF